MHTLLAATSGDVTKAGKAIARRLEARDQSRAPEVSEVQIGGTVIIERLFSYEGLGNMAIDAVVNRDLPLIQSCAMIFCLVYLLLITIADVIAILANPRLR